MKIIILDAHTANPGDLSWESILNLGDVTIYQRTERHETLARCEEADAVLTNKVVMDANIIGMLPKLKYIGVLATGYNVVDLEAAKARGIVVTNIPAYSTDSVVQMTFAHMLNLTNRIGDYSTANRTGRWSRNTDFCYWDAPIHELAGKTLGIVGLGNIGMRVATMARIFGLDVFAVTGRHSADLPEGIQKTTLDGLLAVSDILSLHCPLTDKTFEIINATTLAKMKHGALLINTGRGPLVNEKDVADALLSGQLAGYGADVMCQEPPSADNPLFSAPNAYITPHIAWATIESRRRLISIAAENLLAFMNGNPANVVS